MSKKRTAAESNNDEQTTEDSDQVFQQQSDAKRAKLVLVSDTTLEDLPIELLIRILVEVVVMEVKDMRLAKSVWKRKADLLINRLCTVCSPWSNICSTKYFRQEVHRTLDGTAQKIRFEMVHKYPIPFPECDTTSVKNDIFMLCKPNDVHVDYIINVLDRNDMAEVKDVIPLPGISSCSIAGCNISNCVYVLNMELLESKADSILRITKAGENQFTLSPWMVTDQKLSLLTISANGNIITKSKKLTPNPCVLSIYAANGSLLHKVVLYPDIYEFRRVENVIQRSNGNLVLVLRSYTNTAKLIEIDTFGSIVRRYESSLERYVTVLSADIHGKILICNDEKRIELLDSEFNLLDVCGVPVQPNDAWIFLPCKMHFDYERNEILSELDNVDPNCGNGLAIFRFVSE